MDDVEHVEVDLQLRPTGDVAVVLHLLSDDEGAQESLDGNGPPPESVLTSFEWSADANYMRDHMAKLVAFTPDLDVLRLSNCDSVTDHVLEILSPLTNLAWLDLSRCSYITDEGMPWLKSFSNLEHLDLDQCIGVGDAGIQELACLAKLTYLDIGRPPRDIWLSHISSYARQLPSKGEKITDSTLIALESLKQLEWLGLNYTDITGQGLAALSQYEQLERLELGGCDIADVEALCDIPQLKFLSLRNCDSVSDGTVVTLGKITQLMGLDLGGCDFITDDGLEPLMSLQELRTLSVARCKRLTHDGLLYIGYLYNLRHLDLSGLENLFGYGLDSLSQLNELWWLNLTGNKNVTDDGLKCLTSLQSLKLLGLGSCIKVTLDGLNHFLPYLKNLKFLDLSHTPRIRPRSRLAPLREKLCRSTSPRPRRPSLQIAPRRPRRPFLISCRAHKIAVLPGDGIGPEITKVAVPLLKAAGDRAGTEFVFEEAAFGGVAIDTKGSALPIETLKICQKSDAVLLGAIGGDQWNALPPQDRPERGLLNLRSELKTFANLRPALVLPQLAAASSLKKEVISGVDLMIIRELNSGIYYGEPRGIKTTKGERIGFNSMVYSESEIENIARVAFDLAMKRGRRLCSVGKSNVLEVYRLWEEVVNRVAKDFPEVQVEHMYVDNACMQLISRPMYFDTIVTGNMFGDIMSDAAAALTGSLGLLPSASLSSSGPGLFEPVHGSAPTLAGKDVANPLAMVLSASMMCRYGLDVPKAADLIESAVTRVLDKGYRTMDIQSEGTEVVSCSRMGELLVEEIKTPVRHA